MQQRIGLASSPDCHHQRIGDVAALIDQPITRRVNGSMTAAIYSQPSAVPT
jgi:hypothetical protein